MAITRAYLADVDYVNYLMYSAAMRPRTIMSETVDKLGQPVVVGDYVVIQIAAKLVVCEVTKLDRESHNTSFVWCKRMRPLPSDKQSSKYERLNNDVIKIDRGLITRRMLEGLL